MRDALQFRHFLVRAEVARNLHLKNRFPWSTAEENHFASVLGCDGASQGKTKACSLLFSFAHKRLEQALAYLFRNAGAGVDHIDDDLLFAHFHRYQDTGLAGGSANGLTGVEKEIENCALNLLFIDDNPCFRGIVAEGFDPDPLDRKSVV